MKKVYVNVTTRLIIEMGETVTVEEVISEMDYDFYSSLRDATIIDTLIVDHEIQNPV